MQGVVGVLVDEPDPALQGPQAPAPGTGDLVVTETQPDQAVVSAAGTAADKITFSYAATVV